MNTTTTTPAPLTLAAVALALEAHAGGDAMIGHAGGGVACIRLDALDGRTYVASTGGMIPTLPALPDPDGWDAGEWGERVDLARVTSWDVAVYASPGAADDGEPPVVAMNRPTLADALALLPAGERAARIADGARAVGGTAEHVGGGLLAIVVPLPNGAAYIVNEDDADDAAERGALVASLAAWRNGEDVDYRPMTLAAARALPTETRHAASVVLARDVVDAWRYGAGDLATLPAMTSDADARAVVAYAAHRARGEGRASLTPADAAAYVVNAAHDALPGDDAAVGAWLAGSDVYVLALATAHVVATLAMLATLA